MRVLLSCTGFALLLLVAGSTLATAVSPARACSCEQGNGCQKDDEGGTCAAR